jgi:tricorn protease
MIPTLTSAESTMEWVMLKRTVSIRMLVCLLATCFACSTAPPTLAATSTATAPDAQDTRMLAQPAIHGDRMAFVYAADLWISKLDGSDLRRLTTHSGSENRPRFSPDGRTLAFSAQYDGNTDVFVVPATGGIPRRLTWHPGADIVQDFTPDGTAVLFTSQRAVHSRRFFQLFTIPLIGGFPTRLPVPHAVKAAWSPDGGKIAYVPRREPFLQWKNYRGGTASRIWIQDLADNSVEQIPQPEGRCNDTDPMWIGDTVMFLSDRNGEFNLFSYRVGSSAVEQVTEYEDFPVLSASAGTGTVAYEQAGWLHVLAPNRGSRRLKIGVPADLIETRPRYAKGADSIRDAGLSPSGKRVLLGYRGEIVTLPAKKGDQRNLTRTPGAHERHPAWSPDGRRIAYFSDAGGEYALHVASATDRTDVRVYPLDGHGFYEDPKWSPDSKRISYSDNSWSLYVLDLESGDVSFVAQEPLYGPIKTLHHAWSPDSRWLAYTLGTEMYFRRVFLYEIETGESQSITDGLSDVAEPVFDDGGKVLYFTASTDAGPTNTWFAQSNADMERTNALYLVVLDANESSPFGPESDEEEVADEEDEDEEDAKEDDGDDEGDETDRGDADDASDDTSDEADDDEAERVVVDFEGLDQRIVALPLPTAHYSSLHTGKAGQLYYLETDSVPTFGSGAGKLALFDLETRKAKSLADHADGFTLSADHSKMLVVSHEKWAIVDAGSPVKPGEGALAVDSLEVKIDPRAEWPQIFDEAWRINRDYFYDPGMHGADWPAMREKYATFLPHLATRGDLNRVIRWMCSELAVGHHSVGGGDTLVDSDQVSGGLLGADYEVADGRYRFAKVLGGLNWTPDLRAPLTQPGALVTAGEYLLAVDGEDLRPLENLYERFENTAGKIVKITVGAHADGTDSRTIDVVPIGNEAALRNRDWVEGNIRRVTEATDGRVAYVHVPDTGERGHTYFKRYFFPQADRDAIIIDERGNSGGLFADYYIDILRRPHIADWAMRYGRDLESPLGAVQGPKVMLIDEGAGSGGDMLPWMFRKLEMGTLVGRPTWGGLVGILGFPTLMDGGRVTAPNLGIWTEDGFIVENVGIAPDVEVEQWPAEVAAGLDPQLEKAIEIALEQLAENPPVRRTRPPFPIRARSR